MKYLSEFQTLQEYEEAKESLPLPHISRIIETNGVIYNSTNDFSISTDEIEADENGGDFIVTISTQKSWTAYTNNDWITISPLTGSSEEHTATITVNSTTISRNGVVYFTNGSVTKSLSVEQTFEDYSQKYLTFRVLSDGTIAWKSAGSGVNRVIQYSKNDGEWTSITASASATIPVTTGDVVRFKGTNASYATNKTNYSAFYEGTATYDVEGNIMSLIYGDDFIDQTVLTSSWALSNVFNHSMAISAENLIVPAMTLTEDCYRAMFSNSYFLIKSPKILPATTLATRCYYYMFDNCYSLETAPKLPASTLVDGCYYCMFHTTNRRNNIDYIECLATNPSTAYTNTWCKMDNTSGIGVAENGVFVKAASANWPSAGVSSIPTNWVVYNDEMLYSPIISCNSSDIVSITCKTSGAELYYRLNGSGSYSAYTNSFSITADTLVEAYSVSGSNTSPTISCECIYSEYDTFEYSNRDLKNWEYNSSSITTPYSINAIDGHSSTYNKSTFIFKNSFNLDEAEPTYLWFQHADQSADIYIDDTKVETHWGGYNAFFSDVTNYVHSGQNEVKVALCNTTRTTLAPREGDFNFNATLGNVKLFTSTVLPDKEYGYDGFHVTSEVTSEEATIYIKTSIPTGASVTCKIDSGITNIYNATSASTGEEMVFTKVIANPHLWNGTIDPYLYTITLEIYKGGDLYHRYVRPYGLRYYEYVINDTTKYGTVSNPYTGFLLNGAPYLLRGVCMHDDLANKANALNDADYVQEFNIIQELGCNFLRLAHYPHPKEVYDKCDELGIIVQTEAPWVNQSTTSETEAYWNSIEIECEDMVKQHYNHPCIMFWGVGNEINHYTNTEDGKNLVKSKIEGYRNTIRTLLPGALVGYTVSHSTDTPLTIFNNPTVDWVGCNIYVGWYINKSSNNPTTALNTRINKTIVSGTPMAFSEYGCGGTPTCHSDDFMTTTTRGNNPRHDIEYMMWLHEGHIAAIKNFPQLLFTSQWQLFDIAVSNRNEGYTVCLDGENTSTDNNLKYLNNKGLVERDHVTKKDTFYLYKAWWNPTPFVHICGKNYTKKTSRVIKCYTNYDNALSLYVNNTFVESVTPSDNIATFTAYGFNSGDVVRVDGNNISDTFTFE